MLFWIFFVILAVGIGLYVWYHKHYKAYSFLIEIVYCMLNTISCAGVVISIIFMSLIYTTADGMVNKNKQIYNSLTYQYENAIFDNDDDVVGKKELYNQIQDWNEDLAYYQSVQDNFWIGIYYPNVFDQFDYIDLQE